MEIFTNKKIWQKIAIALVIVLLFQFIVASPVRAGWEGFLEFTGGVLLKPIFSLLVSIGDGVMELLHTSIMGTGGSIITINTESDFWQILKGVIAVVITVACVIGAFVLSGGVAAVLGTTALLSIISTTFLGSNIIVNTEDAIGFAIGSYFNENQLPSELALPMYSYSPEEIFKGNILLFNVNFFRDPVKIETEFGEDGEVKFYYIDENNNGTYDDDIDTITSKQDSAAFLQRTVSSWYKTIRNICIVIMLSVLVYIGIRMLLSSIASDRAKYLTMLKDWAVGICLLFMMHYIMAFSVTIVEKLTDIVGTSLENGRYIVEVQYTSGIEESLKEINMEEIFRINKENAQDGYAWPTNLMGYLRMKSQMGGPTLQYVGEAIMFLVLVVFTVMFTFTYLKRLLYMAFLTIIAPMVALTYCIDKINDGQAQGFNTWLKEYIFNLLIQPMHLLLYYILVTTSLETMGDNVIYALVALEFMLPAEKLLRNLFGFQKAHTPPMLGGPTGTALMMNGINKLSGVLSGKGAHGTGKVSNNSKESIENNELGIKRTKFTDTSDLVGNMQFDIPDKESEIDVPKGQMQFDIPDEPIEELSDSTQTNNIRMANTEPQETLYNTNNQPLNRRQKVVKAMKNPEMKRTIKNKAKGKLKNGALGALRVARGTIAGTAIGAATMGVGAAATIAMGDPDKLVTAAGVAATAGISVGKRATNARFKKPADYIDSDVRRAFESSYMSKEEIDQKLVIDKMKDKGFKQELIDEFKSEEIVDQMYEDGTIQTYLEHGRDNVKDIHNMQKVVDNGYADNTEQVIAFDDLRKGSVGNRNLRDMSNKDKKELVETIDNNIAPAVNGDKDKTRRVRQRAMDGMQALQDVENGRSLKNIKKGK